MSDVFTIQGTYSLVDKVSSKLDQVSKSVDKNGKQVKSTEGQYSSFSNGIGSKASAIAKAVTSAFTVTAIVGFTKKIFTLASDLDQTQKRTGVIFGDMAKDVQDWASENERNFGLGSGTIEKFVGDVADITQGMGMAKDASLEMGKGVVDIGTKLANWGGTDATTTFNDLNSAITGSHKSVEKYGIKLNDATLSQTAMNMGLGDSFSALSEADKALVRYETIVNSSQNAVDFWNEGNRNASFYLTEVKEQVANVGENLGTILLPIITPVIKGIADFIEKIVELTSGFGTFNTEATEGFIQAKNTIMEAFGILWDTIKSIFDTIAKPLIDLIKEMFSDMGVTSGGVLQGMSDAFLGFCKAVQDFWDAWGKPLWEIIIQVIGWVKDMFMEHWDKIYSTFETVIGDLIDIWNTNLKPMFEAIVVFVRDVLAPVFKWLLDNVISPVFGAIVQFISGAWTNGIKPIFTGIIDFITGVFSGDWGKAWDGVCSIFSGIFGGLGELIKVPINAVIGIVNKAIDSINEISVEIPDWVPKWGGSTFGLNLKNISYLEKGGILTEPTMLSSNVMAGEKNKGRQGQAEAVIPLDRLFTELNAMFEKNLQGYEQTNNSFNVTINNAKATASEIAKQFKQEQRKLAMGF